MSLTNIILNSSFRRISRVHIVLFLALVLLTSCNLSEGEEQNEEMPVEQGSIQRVEVVHPSFMNFSSEILITGTTEANRQVMIHSMENGMVKSILKDIGDHVQKGEVLARLDNPELLRKKQQLQAELQGASLNYERLKAAYDSSPAITPAKLIDEANAAQLSLQAKLDGINDRISFLNVRAPFSGLITMRNVDEGTMVQNGINDANAIALFELQQTDPIRIMIPVPERDAGFIHTGMLATITIPELPGDDYTLAISRSSGALDKDSRTMKVEIDMSNTDGRVKAGMYAKVRINLNSREKVTSLPVTAQVIHQNEPCIYIVEDGVVQRIPIRKGLVNKDYFEVLNPEVTLSSSVIINGKGLVKPGDNVEAIVR